MRPYFKDISDGKLPRVEFPEYVDMHEYQNIQTRMLGADSFPYRNITVTDEVRHKFLIYGLPCMLVCMYVYEIV